MKENELDKIEFCSEEFQDILGAVPHWILGWEVKVEAHLKEPPTPEPEYKFI